jgi:hypothetical protein
MLDAPPLLDALAAVFGTPDFAASGDASPTGSFAHADFCLPGATSRGR